MLFWQLLPWQLLPWQLLPPQLLLWQLPWRCYITWQLAPCQLVPWQLLPWQLYFDSCYLDSCYRTLTVLPLQSYIDSCYLGSCLLHRCYLDSFTFTVVTWRVTFTLVNLKVLSAIISDIKIFLNSQNQTTYSWKISSFILLYKITVCSSDFYSVSDLLVLFLQCIRLVGPIFTV